MPLKLVAARNKKTKTIFIRGTYLGTAWTRAAALLSDPSLLRSSSGSKPKSSVVNIRKKPRLIVDNN